MPGRSAGEEMTDKKFPFEIVPCGPRAEGPVLELLRASLGETAAARPTKEFWEWKHVKNPFGESYGIYAWDGERKIAAGLRALMRWRFNAPDGARVYAVRAVDTATHPDCQRKGIFSVLTKRAIEDLEKTGTGFIFNTPNEKSLPGYLKMGWKVVSVWPMYVRVIRPLKVASFFLGLIKPADKDLPAWNSFFKEPVIPWREFEEKYGPELHGLVEESEEKRKKTGLRTPRSMAYLGWRYGGHPFITYGVYALGGREGLEGFAVLRPNMRFGLKEVVITEVFLKNWRKNEARRILRGVSSSLKSDYAICHFSDETIERDALSGAFFFRSPKTGMTFTVRQLGTSGLSEAGADPTKAADWDLTLGDLEVF